jgi:hypothetical protein
MRSTQKWWFVVVAAVGFVLLTSGRASAGVSAGTANVYLDGVGSGTILAGVYTSPYSTVITPGSTSVGTGPSVPAICDDFYDNSYIDEDWNTNVTSLSSLSSASADTTLKWGSSASTPDDGVNSVTVDDVPYGGALDTTLTQVQAYDAAALLSISILGSTPAGDQQQQDLSYALWALFDTSQSLTQLSGDPTDQANAISDLNTAVQEVINGEVGTTPLSAYLSNYNVTIYSYSGVDVGGTSSPTTCPSGTCDPPPQEMITVTSMSEPPSLGVFAVYFLLGGGCLLFFGRRGILKADS